MKNNCIIKFISLSFFALSLLSCVGRGEDQKIDLSGEWSFQIDSTDIGAQEGWYAQVLTDTINLPGTIGENRKGIKNDEVKLNSLTRCYLYEGKAWYQREVNIPNSWKDKEIKLFLERTKATEVWVNEEYFPIQTNIQTPHIYNITKALIPGKNKISICVNNSFKLFPVGGSHALSDHTQTNWNGIIGKIELQATDKVYIKATNIYPDIENQSIKIVFKIENPTNKKIKGGIVCKARGFNGHAHSVEQQTFEFSSGEKSIELVGTYSMGSFATWDEFSPKLYKLSASLNAESAEKTYYDRAEETFGMVEFGTKGTQFLVNGKVVLLRGKNDCCVFPLTGYPPMDKEEWIRQMKISKEYGINHYRFHSWTPPRAAFEAADIVGIYIQSELPCWRSFKENDPKHFNYQQREGELILENYINHPSFVMFTLGNELVGSRDEMARLIEYFKQCDSNVLFA